MYKINNGATFHFLTMITGLVCIGIALYLFIEIQNLFAGIGLSLFGILIVPGIKVTEIDLDKKRITKKLRIGPLLVPFHRLKSEDYSEVILTIFKQNQQMALRSQTSHVRTKSFDVILKGDEDLILYESPDYKKSQKVLKEVSESLNIPSHNHYEALKESAQNKRYR